MSNFLLPSCSVWIDAWAYNVLLYCEEILAITIFLNLFILGPEDEFFVVR